MGVSQKRAQVSLSFDVDWAADEILEDTIALLDGANVKATFYATHRTPVLERLDRKRYEIGVHPNLVPLLEGKSERSFREVLKEVMGLYDDVVGIRSHGLVTSGALHAHSKEVGLLYESNIYVPSPVPAFRDYDGLLRIAMYWSDWRELLVGTPYRADRLPLPADIPGILAFHPICVFLNSEKPSRYLDTKHLSLEEKRAARHTGSPKGTRDFLIDLLERIERENIETLTMREVAEAHVNLHGETIATHPES